jgi:hypothetical protein
MSMLSDVTLANPMLQEAAPRHASWGTQILTCLSFLMGLGFAVLLSINSNSHEASPATLLQLGNLGLARGPAYSALPLANSGSQFRKAATPIGSLQDYGISSSPLAKLAIAAIDANDRRNQGRAVSMKAVQSEVVSGWSTVDDKTREKLSKVVNQVEVNARESLTAGITAPLGFFDPLGFATTATTGGKLLFYREVELKHGRVAMLASLGIVVGEQFHPLFGGNIDVPSAVAFQETPLETFWPAVVAAIAIPEIFSVFSFQDPSKGEQWAIRTDHVPGDLGFDPLGLKPKDPKEFKEMQSKELNNGRLAMIAAAGMIAQEIATGQKLF